MTETAQQWVDQARYDLDTARAMLSSGRYLYVLFCCQQSVEKALKALIIHRTGAFPPRIHNLPNLAEAAGVSLEKKQRRFVGQLSIYYVQTRYPEEVEALARETTEEKAGFFLRGTEELIEWLFSKLT